MDKVTEVLPPEQVAEAQARANAATRDDWYGNTEQLCVYAHGAPILALHPFAYRDYRSRCNIEFVAHARTDVPALCESHEILRADKERLERELAEAREIERLAREYVAAHGATTVYTEDEDTALDTLITAVEQEPK